jgi:NhaA family Na+:H+ antiporter
MPAAEPPIASSRLAPFLKPLFAFLAAESAGGVLLLAATIAALVWANSPWSHGYHAFWHMQLGGGSGVFAMSLEHWVNDGLMAIFFLLVGLEIKRELLLGELASFRRAALPVVAAIGGMVVPALIYFAVNARGEGAHGWGVPMATDIAFAVGAIALVGRSLPTAATVFLLAVAIVDDLGAVLVIAIFYTHKIALAYLAAAGGCFAVLAALNGVGVRRVTPYLVIGALMWAAMLASGIHATVAGVLLALSLPAKPRSVDDETPLLRVEHALLKPVNFLIVPIFALANAGVDVRSGAAAAIHSPVTWGIVLGLVLGKPIGIFAASWLSVRARIAALPDSVSWPQIFGISVLCGIGFTMSLFIANLAFAGNTTLLADAKLGILAASVIAGIFGCVLIKRSTRPAARPA